MRPMGSWTVLIVHLTEPKVTWKDVRLYRSGSSVGISVGDCCNHINDYEKTQTKTSGTLPWVEITEKKKQVEPLMNTHAFLLLLLLTAMLPSSPCNDGLEPGTVS